MTWHTISIPEPFGSIDEPASLQRLGAPRRSSLGVASMKSDQSHIRPAITTRVAAIHIQPREPCAKKSRNTSGTAPAVVSARAQTGLMVRRTRLIENRFRAQRRLVNLAALRT
jgi:hypothetical protein